MTAWLRRDLIRDVRKSISEEMTLELIAEDAYEFEQTPRVVEDRGASCAAVPWGGKDQTGLSD